MSESNGYATREALLGPLKRRFADVDIAGWGKVRLRSLSELERSRIEASMLDKKGQLSSTKIVDIKCRWIVAAVVDGDGNPILTNSDIPQLQQQDSSLTDSLMEAIKGHCGISDRDLEELEKN